MNCRDCQDLLNRRLGGENGERDLGQSHLDRCPARGAQWNLAGRLQGVLRPRNPPVPSEGLSGRILAAALRDRAAPRRLVTWPRLALAAAVLLAVGGGVFLTFRGSNQPDTVIVEEVK